MMVFRGLIVKTVLMVRVGQSWFHYWGVLESDLADRKWRFVMMVLVLCEGLDVSF